MSQDLIRYDVLAQDALRGVIRKVLGEVAKTGLPGEHHFFITFLTSAPGVRISSRLREKYPDLMTIVVQHQYWDLNVTETSFEIGLSFSDIPEKLFVPFSSVRGFYDPSVNFELEFDVRGAEAANTDDAEDGVFGESAVPTSGGALSATPLPLREKPAAGEAKADGGETTEADERPDAQVVSLDAFRKKP
ncbi:SspB family protein [Fulvimarina sp. 2208YS6-2-32]|uniref:SspB family protein n=1 Tax=Fulvimarina uroteuthidis TaxID=3098149 RepID=A0ABU5I1B8_9HYPH|nr:SspB family protein [Fulvimarina sp. 2208YS6-2-32]MDY8108609.1 SspB family protein [Fulvimarina sp. 2208YS6-2-32]